MKRERPGAARRKRSAAPARKPRGQTRPARSARTKASPAARAARRPPARADLGAPIEGFLARQPPQLRAILEALRALVGEAAPEAEGSLKWGMPFFTIGRTMVCGLGAHRAHVNLILPGPTGTYGDPEGRLEGESKLGRHLKLTSLDELPRDAVRGWLRTAAELARRR